MTSGSSLAAAFVFAATILAGCQPETKPPEASPQIALPKGLVAIEIRNDGSFWLGDEPVAKDELERRLKATPIEGTQITIQPDPKAPYDAVRDAFEIIQRTDHIKKFGVIGGT